jgi:hypothetical protein
MKENNSVTQATCANCILSFADVNIGLTVANIRLSSSAPRR